MSTTIEYWGYLDEYIGWSTYNAPHHRFANLQHGFLLGKKEKKMDNIFIKSNFEYKSNNQFYKKKLPNIKTGDTIIMKYDSNDHVLSFYKSNDAKLNSKIVNLPSDKTFYWFVGRFCDILSVTIV